MIGACGGVGCSVALGLAALRRKLAGELGLVSTLPPFRAAGLVEFEDIVVGGHEVRPQTLESAAQELHKRAGVFDAELLKTCKLELRAAQRNIRPGTLFAAGSAVRKLAESNWVPNERHAGTAIERLTADLKAFQKKEKLARVIVVHLASSEPPFALSPVHGDFARLQRSLTKPGLAVLPPSSLYALAAVQAGCGFINFTPSLGVRVPAIRERAAAAGVPYMGDDGKTGETLIKSALAPMFAMRHLEVLSWFGQNILGNRDGEVLQDPETRLGKIRSKDRTVASIVGGTPSTKVSIDYVPSLDDWKVAWDFIHFRGFLGTKMSMQFTWQGCDSLLAAPLVIDLVRFADLEMRAGRGGAMTHLSFFFKDPLDVEVLDLSSQWQRLIRHVDKTSL